MIKGVKLEIKLSRNIVRWIKTGEYKVTVQYNDINHYIINEVFDLR